METTEKNGKLYAIRSNQTDKIYVGSTFEKYLSNRLSGHRGHYKLYLSGKYHYVSSFKLLEFDDYYIELVSEHGNISKLELRRLEGEHTRANKKIAVNKVIEGRTKKQWSIDNADTLRDKRKQWMTDNADKHKQWFIDNKDKRKQYQEKYCKQYYVDKTDAIKEKTNLYRSNNVELIKKRKDQYYIDNSKKLKEKHTCDFCGGKYTTASRLTHNKTKKHIKATEISLFKLKTI